MFVYDQTFLAPVTKHSPGGRTFKKAGDIFDIINIDRVDIFSIDGENQALNNSYSPKNSDDLRSFLSSVFCFVLSCVFFFPFLFFPFPIPFFSFLLLSFPFPFFSELISFLMHVFVFNKV